VRENSLKVFGEAYTILGEDIWRLLKDVPLKVKGLLESRFKQIAKKSGTTGNLNMSMGGNTVKNKLGETANSAVKRKSVMPAQSSMMGLHKAKANQEQSINSSNNASMKSHDKNSSLPPLNRSITP
jgi:hypothetical protein